MILYRGSASDVMTISHPAYSHGHLFLLHKEPKSGRFYSDLTKKKQLATYG